MFSFVSTVVVAFQLLAVYVVYFIAKCLYRITLHPLARFPGPKKAAVSRLYAMSWDIPFATSYVKEFTKWHDEYDSAVVRIEPNHLHFRDIDAYNEIFKIGTKFTRDPAIYNFPFTTGSFFNKLDQKTGLVHRNLYNQFFSKTAVQKLEPMIQQHVSQFLSKIEDAAMHGRSVDMSLGFRCLTADTLMRYAYDKNFGALKAPDFQDPMIMKLEEMFETGPAFAWYGGSVFVTLIKLIKGVPRKWLGQSSIGESLKILDGCRKRLIQLSQEHEGKETPHVFKTALAPNVAKGQPKLSIDDMAADGFVFFSAGTDTTANTLTYALYHLIRNPHIHQTLQSELRTALPQTTDLKPDPTATKFPLLWSDLENLPYLHAVIKEALRIGFGLPGKVPRIVPREGITLLGQFIPGGTAVSSTTYAYYTNPNYYVDPLDFKPERWMQDEDGGWSGNNGVDPEKHFITFSRGSRSCIGMNLAYAELNYTLAYLVRNFEMVLDIGPGGGMKESDMEWHDCFVVATFGHLRVKARRLTN